MEIAIKEKQNNVKQIIIELFRDNYRRYPEDYKEPKSAKMMAALTAQSYWDHRSEWEVQRDREAQLKLADYKQWCKDELKELQSQTKPG